MRFRTQKAFHFALLGLAFGLAYMIAIPPFQIPDEPHHFYRSYQISRGQYLSQKQGNACGGEMPKNIIYTARKLYGDLPFHPDRKQDIGEILAMFHIPLDENHTEFINFSNTALYSPIPYIPQITGIWIGKVFNTSPVMLLYLGRFFNLLCSVALIAWAIHITPVFKNVFFLLALMPMTLQQIASLSPDALTISLSFLLMSAFLYHAQGPGARLHRKDIIFLCIVSGLLAFCKMVYFPIVFLYFIIPVQKGETPAGYYTAGILLMTITITCLFLWGTIAKDLNVIHLQGGMPYGLAKLFIISYPIDYLGMVWRNITTYLPFYLHSFVGILGCLDTPLPIALVVIYGMTLLVVAVLDGKQVAGLSGKAKLLILAMALICVLLIITSQYFIWTLETSPEIGTGQGRYFIPIAPLFLLILHNNRLKDWISPYTLNIFTSGFAVCTLIISLPIIIFRYYI